MTIKRLYWLLIEPAQTIISRSERRRVRALSILTIAISFLTLVGLSFGAPVQIALLAFVIGYGLTRTPYYRIGALVILFGIYNSSFAILSNPGSTLVALTNAYLVLFVGVIFGGAWLSPIGSSLNVLFLLFNLFAISWVNPGLSANGPAPLIMIVSLTFVFGSLVTLTNSLSRLDQRELDAQYAEIASQAELLTQKNAGLERAGQEAMQRNQELAEAHAVAIRSSNELRKYFQAIEQGGTAIVITDTAGKIEYVNPRFSALTGYSRDEAIGQNPRILKSGLQPREYYELLWQTISAGQIWHGEFHNKRKDGSLFWEAATIAPIQNQDHVITNYVAIKEDITTARELQQQLAIARDQALEASRFKSQLLAKVSHELRTPLGSAIGYAELLQNDILGPVSEEQKQALGNIIDSGNYLNLMINELLDQAQIESKSVKLRMTPFSPSELLSHLMSIVSVLATNNNLSCCSSIAPDLPDTLYGDSKRIQQIVINLTGNAIKFTTVGEVRVDILYPDPEHWSLRVSDTGTGIPPEAQTYIFEPFRQTDSAITNHNRGIGLGLSITKQLVELMGGQITLESEMNKGSVFTVILPLIKQPES